MRLSGLILGLILAAAPSTVSQVKDPNARASGRVLDEDTNAPISGARVVFAFRGRTRLQAVTDENGRYTFADLEPGPYRLTVQKAGHVPLADPSRLPTFWVVAGQSLDVITVSLRKTGAIAGRILDPSGEPLVDINVRAVKPGTANLGAAASRTNDLGEFRVFGLLPGEYIIAASPQPFGLDSLPASPALLFSTFYPGTADAAAAQTLTVGPGQTVAGIEFRVLTASTFKVSGTVVDERGIPASGAAVRLAGDSRASGGIAAGVVGEAQANAAGRFSIDHVTIRVVLRHGGDAAFGPCPGDRQRGGCGRCDDRAAAEVRGAPVPPPSETGLVPFLFLGFILAVALSSEQAPQARTEAARISGRVVEDGTSAPLSGARITVLPARPGTRCVVSDWPTPANHHRRRWPFRIRRPAAWPVSHRRAEGGLCVTVAVRSVGVPHPSARGWTDAGRREPFAAEGRRHHGADSRSVLRRTGGRHDGRGDAAPGRRWRAGGRCPPGHPGPHAGWPERPDQRPRRVPHFRPPAGRVPRRREPSS